MSNKNISLSIDLNALNEFIAEHSAKCVKVGKNGKKYFNIKLKANEQPDNYGNDFSAKPQGTKELTAAGIKGKLLPFIGNAKFEEPYDPTKYSAPAAQTPIRNAAPKSAPKVELDEEVPF
jgi:hypothetical protein